MKPHRILLHLHLHLLLLVVIAGCSPAPTPAPPSSATPAPVTPSATASATQTTIAPTRQVFRNTDTPRPTVPTPTEWPTSTPTPTITARPTFTPRANTPVPLEGLEAISLTNFQQIKLVSRFFLDYEHLKDVNTFNPDVVFSPDSRLLAFLDQSRVVLWDINNQQIQHELTVEFGFTTNFPWGAKLAFSPNGHYLATTGWTGPIVWDAQTGETVIQAASPAANNTETDLRYSQDYTDLVFTMDGAQIITGSYFAGTSLTFWDWRAGKILRQSGPTGNGIHDVDLSPDGKTIFAAVRGGQVNVFDTASGELLDHRIGSVCMGAEDCEPSYWVCMDSADEIELTPNGKLFAVRCRPNDPEYVHSECTQPDDMLSPETLRNICYSTNLYSAESWKLVGYLSEVTPTAASVTFNSDGGIAALAVGDPVDQVKLFNTLTQAEIHTIEGFPGEVAQVAFSPNGQLLLVRMTGGEVLLYGVRQNE